VNDGHAPPVPTNPFDADVDITVSQDQLDHQYAFSAPNPVYFDDISSSAVGFFSLKLLGPAVDPTTAQAGLGGGGQQPTTITFDLLNFFAEVTVSTWKDTRKFHLNQGRLQSSAFTPVPQKGFIDQKIKEMNNPGVLKVMIDNKLKITLA
jgi:hypothetical protein